MADEQAVAIRVAAVFAADVAASLRTNIIQLGRDWPSCECARRRQSAQRLPPFSGRGVSAGGAAGPLTRLISATMTAVMVCSSGR